MLHGHNMRSRKLQNSTTLQSPRFLASSLKLFRTRAGFRHSCFLVCLKRSEGFSILGLAVVGIRHPKIAAVALAGVQSVRERSRALRLPLTDRFRFLVPSHLRMETIVKQSQIPVGRIPDARRSCEELAARAK